MATTQQPAFQAYTVVKREGQEDFWLNIGAAFLHQDGEGYNIILQALPVAGGKIVLRPPKAKEDEEQAPPSNNARRQDNNFGRKK